MSAGRVHRDLDTVLQLVKPENRRVVQAVAEALALVEFQPTTSYIKAKRRDGGPDIRIATGWCNGFISREEALTATGGFVSESDLWPSDARPDLFGAWLPSHEGRDRGPRTPKSAPSKVCPGCNTAIPATGVCDVCG
ncbi:hypothetical protein [Nocardioides sp. SYSU DS0651]|uniref:hypothetical protein n=1 Tax=Nocardioides sp. SYSU DS0651 TaxID=3415955 RepID=UPI003F4C32A5